MSQDNIRKVLNFWFDGIDRDTVLTDSPTVKKWFKKNDQFDEEIRLTFLSDHNKARKRKYESWEETPEGMLALIIIFDQFSRNIYRNSEKAFENDLRVLELCLLAIKKKYPKKLNFAERQFMYMPLMHSESIAIQEKSIEAYEELLEQVKSKDKKNEGYFKYCWDYCVKHYEVIKRFGRFPHRNAILNRKSTPEEVEYLKEPGAGF